MPGSLRVARLFGITIFIHASWVLVAILVYVTFENLFADLFLTPAYRWIAAAATTFLFFSSVLVHELSHSLVARGFQLPVHSITLFVFGGVANLRREPDSAKAEFLMAAVGPFTSAVLALLAWGISGLSDAALGGITRQLVSGVFRQIALVNAILAGFNLLPGFPLDGGRVLRSVLWAWRNDRRTATRIATRGGQLVAAILLLYGLVQLVAEQQLVAGMWSMLIAFFLFNAASASYRQESFDSSLRRVQVGGLMTREPASVPDDLPLASLVSTYILPMRGRAFAVERNGELIGIVSLDHVRQVPQAEWPRRRVGEVMTPLKGLDRLNPEDDARRAFERLMQGETAQLPVFDDGDLVGLFERDVVLGYLRIREELGLERGR